MSRLYKGFVCMKRREALETIAAGVLSLTAAQRDLLDQSDWEAQVLSAGQARTVDVLSDLIIPRTETPGARDAHVHRYIDMMLYRGLLAAERDAFLAGLAALDERCQRDFARGFDGLPRPEQVRLLTAMHDSGDAFFRQVKDLTIRGYYTSREGLLEELEYEGNSYLTDMPGCTHEEHHQ